MDEHEGNAVNKSSEEDSTSINIRISINDDTDESEKANKESERVKKESERVTQQSEGINEPLNEKKSVDKVLEEIKELRQEDARLSLPEVEDAQTDTDFQWETDEDSNPFIWDDSTVENISEIDLDLFLSVLLIFIVAGILYFSCGQLNIRERIMSVQGRIRGLFEGILPSLPQFNLGLPRLRLPALDLGFTCGCKRTSKSLSFWSRVSKFFDCIKQKLLTCSQDDCEC